MADMRDRLIETMKKTVVSVVNGHKVLAETIWLPSVFEAMADNILASGAILPEWISVEDRLPENSEDVVVCHRNGWVTKDAWLGSNWWYQNDVNPITHWMPLPQPPKAEKTLREKDE